MSLKRRLDEAFEFGKKKGIDSEGFLTTWYQYFGFSSDPFYKQPLTWELRSRNLFVDREREIETLAETLGMASVAPKGLLKVALVGADGVGKNTLANIIDGYARERKIEGYILDVDRRILKEGEENYELPGNRAPPTHGYNYAILSNITSKRVNRLEQYLEEIEEQIESNFTVLVIIAPELLRNVKYDREIAVSPLKQNEIVKMLQSRVSAFREISEAFFERGALKHIAGMSLGIPFVALEIAQRAGQIAFTKRKKSIGLDDLHEAENRFSIKNLEDVKITTKERKVLDYILKLPDCETNATGMKRALDMSSHALSYKYLNRLAEKKILRKRDVGRSTYFSLSTLTKIQLQLSLYMRGIIEG